MRGILGSTITNNIITHNQNWGIMVAQSLKVVTTRSDDEVWVCFNSTGNTVTDNFVLGNGADLFHDVEISGNTWSGNTCRVKVGAEIPECLPPHLFFLPLLLRP